jgi:transcriptional regulator with XRE-family HTH domain
MRVIDPKKILKLMAIQEVSARELAKAAGYASHSYIQRILRGEIKTVTPERAARIARFLQVGVDDLFMPRLSTDTSHNVQSHKTPA